MREFISLIKPDDETRQWWLYGGGHTVNVMGLNVTNVTDDTRKVKQGSLYVAIKGSAFDGEAAATSALGNGAVTVLTQTDLGLNDKQILVDNVRLAYAQAASEFYGHPTTKMRLIAVTGTNGKSTVATLIKAILVSKNANKCGFIGTTGVDVCDGNGTRESALTTPKQDELYRLFAEMAANGAQFCVMETSSQALDQYRIANERFAVGIFTGLTQDHLDWHVTMENYYNAKKRLFTMCESSLICTDCDWGKRLAGELEGQINCKTYGVNGADVADYYATNIKPAASGSTYWLCDSRAQKSWRVAFNMPGLFNIANSIAAIAACEQVDVDVTDSVAALAEFAGVRGRCEVIYDAQYTVICDYAHTADALEKILSCTRQFAPFGERRLICVFGAAGERDAEKRPYMGEVVSKYADLMVVTSDNPRFETPSAIIEDVVRGIPDGTEYATFTDRREAIIYALSEALQGDIVLLAGKGHETTQVIGSEEQPFDERVIVKDYFGKESE
ncbi:MAG: UDP-N-acetylmuramoyl-L-alanyl-D-glutamate--2,6-diaminopimelate ligase [Oscillospiraceae bacterium]|nr:UDP-N-acetylmuramoyl-L-alanyl-D-glutamate--2,6-diaminopimelate ligase [Oscillospiraceae bacterium]